MSAHILNVCYERCVRTHLQDLKLPARKNWSDEIYGEVLPSFLQKIFHDEVKLTPESLFLDLGSGVGNTVTHASLSTGCRAFGIEIRPVVSSIATAMAEQVSIRGQLWGIPVGTIDTVCGDLLANAEVSSLIVQADLIWVNHEVFSIDCEYFTSTDSTIDQ